MPSHIFVLAFVSLITIINPFSTASVFITITQDYSKFEKRATAIKATLISMIILIVFAFIGKGILNFFSISIDGLRIAGGILLASIGTNMINQKRKKIHSEQEQDEIIEKEDISIVPLAIPFISGPGAITTIMLLIHESSSFSQTAYVMLATVIACTITGLILIESNYIQKVLGTTGNKVASKIMGLIVLVIGIQFIIDAVHNILLLWGLIV